MSATPDNWRAQADAFLCTLLCKTPQQLEEALAGTNAPAVSIARWVKRLRSGRLPVVLPSGRASGVPEYYGIAFTGRQLRDLREQLMAFVGPTWTDFTGQAIAPDPHDAIERAIAAITDQPVFRIRLPNPVVRAAVRKAIDRMLDVTSAATVRDPEDVRATGRVLRQFYHLLNVGDRAAAEAELQYLHAQQRLDTLNLEFLEVQLRAQCDEWAEIIELPSYGDLVQGRRPVAVSRALLQALYYTYLAPHEGAEDLGAMVAAFRKDVLPRAGTLFSTRAGMREPEVLKQFMLLAVAATPPRPELQRELRNLAADREWGPLSEGDRGILLRLADLGQEERPPDAETPAPTADLLEGARAALEDFDYDRALSMALAAREGPERARVLLLSAYEIDTLEAGEVARKAVAALGPAEQQLLLNSRVLRGVWERVAGGGEGTPPKGDEEAPSLARPAGWNQWLEALEGASVSSAILQAWAEHGAEEWSVDALLGTPGAIEELKTGLCARAEEEPLQDAIALIIRSLQRDPEYPRKALFEVYRELQFALGVGAVGTKGEVANFGELCQAVFPLGMPDGEYLELLDEAKHLWGLSSAPANVEPWLDVVDQFIYYPCPTKGQEPRREWLTAVFTSYATWARAGRLDPADWHSLKLLATESGFGELLADVELPRREEEDERPATGALQHFSGSIAIYTLTEPAGQRAREVLKLWSPACEVWLSHDKVGTQHLQDLARRADLFVMVTGSAKHAATNFIQFHRGGRALVRPAGKGTTSILRSIAHYLSRQGEASRA